ncbi:hypothetical protein SUGI_1193130 [Cryptomeria japonica]|nr:hypothetical protein SUGI_1193130 [Cryptomeria japonica]
MDSASTVKVGGKKRDPCWKHGRPGPKRGDVFCNHCKKIVKGGINRFKYHLAKIQCRDTTSCTECIEEATRDAIATLEAYDQRKATKKRTAEAMAAPRADLSSIGSHTDVGTSGSSLGPWIRAKGTLDSNMENFFIPCNTLGAQPGLLGTAWNKEAHQQAKVACATFFIYNDVPFNAISSPSWDQLVTALTVASKGFKSPSRYEVSGPLLQDEVQNTHALVEEQRTIWEKNGCTILSDGWTDAEWVASPDDADNDLDPFLTNEQLSELERAGEEWDAELAAREEEQEVDHAAEAPISVEDVATTSAPPTQRPQSVLSFSRRRNL